MMQPIEIQTSKARIVLADLPEGATDIMMTLPKDGIIFTVNGMWHQIDLRPKTIHSIIATSKTITEDLAKEVVPQRFIEVDRINAEFKEASYLEDFTSLLLSKGVDVSKDYAVLIVK